MTTQTQVKAAAKAANVSAKWSVEWQEWTIRRIGDHGDTEYFTSDNEDALDQIAFLASYPLHPDMMHPDD